MFQMIRSFLTICLICVQYGSASAAKETASNTVATVEQQSEFSFPPNNTPVTKVFVFGRPVYIRQPFVLPLRVQRDNADNTVEGHGGSVVPFEDSAVVKGDALQQVALPLPSSAFPDPKKRLREGYEGPKYPLPQCYTNDSGFMCCNKKVEQIIKDTFRELQRNKKWQTCNTQSIANRIQAACQAEFKTDFEVLAGVGDFASKAHFYSDLICKVEIEGRFLMAYATPGRHHPKPKPTTTEAPYSEPPSYTEAIIYTEAPPAYHTEPPSSPYKE